MRTAALWASSSVSKPACRASAMRLSAKSILPEEPSGLGVHYSFDPPHMLSCVFDFIDNTGVNAIEHPRKYRPAGLPNNAEDHRSNDQAYQRIGQRKSKPHT